MRDYDAQLVKSTGAQLTQRMLNVALGVKGELEGLANYDKFGSTNPLYTPLKIDGWFGNDTSKALKEFKETYITGESDLVNEETILRKYSNLPPEHDVETVSSVYYQYITGADTMKALMEESKKYDNMVTYNESDHNDTSTVYGLLTTYAQNNVPDGLEDEVENGVIVHTKKQIFTAFAKAIAMQETNFYHATAKGLINSSNFENVRYAKGLYQIIRSTWKGTDWTITDDNNAAIQKTDERRYIEVYNIMGGIRYLKHQYEVMRNEYPSNNTDNSWDLTNLQRMKMAAAAYSRGVGTINRTMQQYCDTAGELSTSVFETTYHNNIEEVLEKALEDVEAKLKEKPDDKDLKDKANVLGEGIDYVKSIFNSEVEGHSEKGWYGYFLANQTAKFTDNSFCNPPDFRVRDYVWKE